MLRSYFIRSRIALSQCSSSRCTLQREVSTILENKMPLRAFCGAAVVKSLGNRSGNTDVVENSNCSRLQTRSRSSTSFIRTQRILELNNLTHIPGSRKKVILYTLQQSSSFLPDIYLDMYLFGRESAGVEARVREWGRIVVRVTSRRAEHPGALRVGKPLYSRHCQRWDFTITIVATYR